MDNRISITLKNQISEIERASQVLYEFGRLRDLPIRDLRAMNLALDEILTNIISYGYDDRHEHQITVRLSLTHGELTAEVEDDGRPFNPLTFPAADTEKPVAERPIGGLGIHMVRTLMDQLDYKRQQDRNFLVMRKKITQA
jgi:serine/threonine-protein kinase RsbW